MILAFPRLGGFWPSCNLLADERELDVVSISHGVVLTLQLDHRYFAVSRVLQLLGSVSGTKRAFSFSIYSSKEGDNFSLQLIR